MRHLFWLELASFQVGSQACKAYDDKEVEYEEYQESEAEARYKAFLCDMQQDDDDDFDVEDEFDPKTLGSGLKDSGGPRHQPAKSYWFVLLQGLRIFGRNSSSLRQIPTGPGLRSEAERTFQQFDMNKDGRLHGSIWS